MPDAAAQPGITRVAADRPALLLRYPSFARRFCKCQHPDAGFAHIVDDLSHDFLVIVDGKWGHCSKIKNNA
jgi:hypothetical protein